MSQFPPKCQFVCLWMYILLWCIVLFCIRQILVQAFKVAQVPRASLSSQNSQLHLLVIDTAGWSLDVVSVSMFWALVAEYL